MLVNRDIIPWTVHVINVKLFSSDCEIVFNTDIELYDCAVRELPCTIFL